MRNFVKFYKHKPTPEFPLICIGCGKRIRITPPPRPDKARCADCLARGIGNEINARTWGESHGYYQKRGGWIWHRHGVRAIGQGWQSLWKHQKVARRIIRDLEL